MVIGSLILKEIIGFRSLCLCICFIETIYFIFNYVHMSMCVSLSLYVCAHDYRYLQIQERVLDPLDL